MAYEDHLKWLRIEANTIEKFQKEAKEAGRLEGIRIGEEQGKLEGKVQRSVEIAKVMLEAGEPVKKIMCFTGLSESDIQKIP
ncbi:MAG: hypothetical protein NMK33_05460 [Candidatus Cardinium sp.]|nr:hypothetical protein [Cardinium endosymbiont of Dermatophagoides farinae]UWW96865.1 MAG: hypothetical protein NMK33_05460 [Candidatus Cardinium sp.]